MQGQLTDVLNYTDSSETLQQKDIVKKAKKTEVTLVDQLNKYQQNVETSDLMQGLDNIHHLITASDTHYNDGNNLEAFSNKNLDLSKSKARLIIKTFGGFTLMLDGEMISFRRKVQKRPLALLKTMIAMGGFKISKTQLTSLLWPSTEGNARISIINTTIFRLRELIGKQAVIVENGYISINPEYCWVDSWELEYVLGCNLNSSEAIDDNLSKIIQLYQGDFLSDDTDSWLQLKKESLRNKMFSILNKYCHWLIKNKDINLAIYLLEQCIRFDGLKEEYYLILMQCQVKKNLIQDALNTFIICKKTLSTQLGILPSIRSQKFYQAILNKLESYA